MIPDTDILLTEQVKNTLATKTNDHVLLADFKQNAIENIIKNGIPANKSEKYKYANIPKIINQELSFGFKNAYPELDPAHIFHCDVNGLYATTFHLHNGHFFSATGKSILTPDGIEIESLRKTLSERNEWLSLYFTSITGNNEEGLLALNSFLFEDGAFIYIPKNVSTDKPIQLVHTVFENKPVSVATRNIIILEEGSSADIMICEHSFDNKQYSIHSTTEIIQKAGSTLNLIRIQNEHNKIAHFTHTFINTADNATTNTYNLNFNGGFIRNNLEVNINGLNCKTNCYGLTIADKDQYMDNYVLMNHNKPNGTSNQLYKNIINSNAEVSFNGKIYVAKDSQKTNAFQSSRAILTDNEGKFNTKPQLEIYADDVKCSHGAAIGKLDEQAMFYMQSRGISYKDAKLLMLYAFADEVIKTIPHPSLKQQLENLTNERLKGGNPGCLCGSIAE
jgi:Fe-S cluster assembly protein SufD